MHNSALLNRIKVMVALYARYVASSCNFGHLDIAMGGGAAAAIVHLQKGIKVEMVMAASKADMRN